MNHEKPENPAEAFGRMMVDWQMIQQLGRNDVEQSAGPEIIRMVNENEITSQEGEKRMRALLNSKQEH